MRRGNKIIGATDVTGAPGLKLPSTQLLEDLGKELATFLGWIKSRRPEQQRGVGIFVESEDALEFKLVLPLPCDMGRLVILARDATVRAWRTVVG